MENVKSTKLAEMNQFDVFMRKMRKEVANRNTKCEFVDTLLNRYFEYCSAYVGGRTSVKCDGLVCTMTYENIGGPVAYSQLTKILLKEGVSEDKLTERIAELFKERLSESNLIGDADAYLNEAGDIIISFYIIQYAQMGDDELYGLRVYRKSIIEHARTYKVKMEYITEMMELFFESENLKQSHTTKAQENNDTIEVKFTVHLDDHDISLIASKLLSIVSNETMGEAKLEDAMRDYFKSSGAELAAFNRDTEYNEFRFVVRFSK